MEGCKNGFNSKHRNGKESNLLKKTDFLLIPLLKDKKGGKFLHYCFFSGHPFILSSIKAKSCQKKVVLIIQDFI